MLICNKHNTHLKHTQISYIVNCKQNTDITFKWLQREHAMSYIMKTSEFIFLMIFSSIKTP